MQNKVLISSVSNSGQNLKSGLFTNDEYNSGQNFKSGFQVPEKKILEKSRFFWGGFAQK